MKKTLAVLFTLACGNTSTPSEQTEQKHHQLNAWCCINGAYYACPTEAAFGQCRGFDVLGCTDGCAFSDFDCRSRCHDQGLASTKDPSACNRDTAKDGQCNGGGTGGGGANTGQCQTNNALPACTVSADCSSRNCTSGRCYGNDVGQLCTVSADCRSTNCTDGCCYGNGVGQRCTVSADCTSRNCTNGRCQ